jgi:hypothetical protein
MIELLPYVALVLGFGVGAIGLLAMLYPKWASKQYGIRAEPPAYPWVRACGVRDIFMGLVFILLWRHGDLNLIAWTCFAVTVVSVTDFLLCWKHGLSRASLAHVVGTVFAAVYGALILIMT